MLYYHNIILIILTSAQLEISGLHLKNIWHFKQDKVFGKMIDMSNDQTSLVLLCKAKLPQAVSSMLAHMTNMKDDTCNDSSFIMSQVHTGSIYQVNAIYIDK